MINKEDNTFKKCGKIHHCDLTLVIPKVSYLNTGKYICAEFCGHIVRMVYVYVNDTNHIFLPPTKNIIEYKTSNKNITIPCRATSPDIKFELKQNGLKAPNFISYDPKHGATVYLNGTSEEDKYMCIGSNEFNKTQELEITVRYKGRYRPIVTLRGTSYIEPNRSKKFTCEAEGIPIPKIYWSFRSLQEGKIPSEFSGYEDFDHEDSDYEDTDYEDSDYEDSDNEDVNDEDSNDEDSDSEDVDYKDSDDKDSDSEEFRIVSKYTLNTNQSGILICKANNTEGSHSRLKEVIITDISDRIGFVGFNVWVDNQHVVVGDTVVLHCAASKYNYSGSLEWDYNDNEEPLISTDAIDVYNETTEYSYRKIIKIYNVTKDYKGEYRCKYGSKSESVRLYVYKPAFVKIYNTNLDSKEIKMHAGSYLKFYCSSWGNPEAPITWKKNGKDWIPDKKRIKINTNCSTDDDINCSEIIISNTIKDDEGNYSCEVSNRFSKAIKSSLLSIIDDKTVSIQDISTWLIIVPTFFFIILIIAVTLLYIKLRNKKRRIAELKNAGLYHFDEGDVQCINPDLNIDDQAALLPYYNEWEFPREKLNLGKVLGAGAFGVVMKAEAQGISNGENNTTVAVKMVRRYADITQVKALVSELKIMVHLGPHVNVVNLLGACTKKLSNIRELCIIVEYCCYGNMLNYLQRHRCDFINQMDPLTGDINTAIGQDILASSGSASAKRSESEKPNLENSNENTCNTEVNILATSTDDVTIVSNYTTQQPEWRLNYQGDYRGNVAPMASQDLLCWAFQIARGMEYLVSRNVLHGDLAARNVLLADNYVVKISDFGLAKNMYNDDNYVKTHNCPLPIKWMALESIRDRIFSVRSDVWSYGIVLWELFSLGQTPYPEMNVDKTFFQKLQDGYRLSKPEFATKELYQVMLQCWEVRPKNRPLFDKLANDIGMMLEKNVREHYINLNSPYVMMNQKKNKGHADYLAMMSLPDVDTSRPTRYINELPSSSNHEISSDSNAGYLCMKPKPALINLDNSKKTDKFSKDATTSEMLPMLIINNSNNKTNSDIESDSEVTTPDCNKNTDTRSFLNPKYQLSTHSPTSLEP